MYMDGLNFQFDVHLVNRLLEHVKDTKYFFQNVFSVIFSQCQFKEYY
jgi:2-polyprenyl-3-methyl-5-hydroxy-6-metoxy-1,4-benzoquinol methylase